MPGSSPAASVASTLTLTEPFRMSATASASAIDPMTSVWPALLYETRVVGAGSGSIACAIKAAIFGVANDASLDQPAFSRILKNRIVDTLGESLAASPNNRDSCVQATSVSPSTESPKRLSSCWHIASNVCTLATPALAATLAKASASKGIVRLHEQRLI